MSKRTKIDPAVLAAEQEAKAARQKAKDTRSLIIRICAAVLILAAAAVICYFMMIHDFNPDRHTLHGTYIAEQSYIYATESGTDTSNERVFPVVFCEDGRMLYKYAASTKTHYYNYAESDSDICDAVISQYYNGSFAREIYVVYGENGDFTMHCTYDSINLKVPTLVEYFGEDMTRSMLMTIFDEDLCNLLIAQDYASITDEQVKKLGVKRENIPTMTFSLKNLIAVFEMHRISDEELSRKDAMALWESRNVVSDSDITVSVTDIVTSSDINE